MLRLSFEDLIKTSVRNIGKNKSRTALTSLGIIIGVTSVILLTSIGNGLEKYVSSQFEALGSNLVFVLPGKIFSDNGGFNNNEAGFLNTKFTIKELNSLRRGIDSASFILPLNQLQTKVKYRQNEESVTVYSSTFEYGKVRNAEPSDGNGRWFTKEEEEKGSRVTILGFETAEKLASNGLIIGRKVVVSGKNLEVIGVADKKGGGGGFGGPDFDNAIYLPLKIGFDLAGNQNITSFLIQSQNNETVEITKREAEEILLKKFDKDAFSVVDQSQILSSINSIIGTLTIALSGIAAISLVVGGIGIMNIMLVTVTERTREIGLRKAVGATPNTILVQFLVEAIFLSCIGGGVGILLGWAGTLGIAKFFPAAVTFQSIAVAFIVSVTVGIIFGVAPARKASKLSPIEALRYE